MSKRKNPTRAQQEAIASYEQLLRKWASVPKFSRTPTTGRVPQAIPALTAPPGRESQPIASLVTPGGSATKPVHGKRYTGTKLLGIGTLHKSNAVPVFSSEEATDMARMRRN